MMEAIAKKTIEQLIVENILNEDKQEIYEYSLCMLMEKIITIVSMIIIACLTGFLIPGIIYMIFFFTLRKRTGGFHARSFCKCYFLSLLLFYFMTVLEPFLIDNSEIQLAATTVSAVVIMCIGTVNHPNMHMNEIELLKSRESARYVLLIELICMGTLKYIGISEICLLFMSFAIIVCAGLMILSKLIKQEV